MSLSIRTILLQLKETPFREAVICVLFAALVLGGSVGITASTGNKVYALVGLALTFMLLVWPVLIATPVFLLWKNPKKYKERDMKRLREQRRKIEERND